MVKTDLIPYQHEAIIVTILTKRELTREEERKVNEAFVKDCPPCGPYKSLDELVEELRNRGLSDIADLIVFPN